MVLINILVFVISLSTVIIIHELGHFIMARRAGILCHEFALGMGPVVWSKRKGETLYVIKLIPIGGYVMMSGEEVEDEIIKIDSEVRLEFEGNIVSKIILDHTDDRYENLEKVTISKVDLKGQDGKPLYINEYEVKRDAFYVMKKREMQVSPHDRGFNGKTLWQRFWAIIAGPGMNFILAFFVFLLVNLIVGFPNIDEPIIGTVGEGYPADGNLMVGDKILEIEGVPIDTWDDLSEELDFNIDDRDVTVTVLRGDDEIVVSLTPVIYFYSIGFHSDENTTDELIIGEVPEGTAAYNAGFQTGDRLVSIAGFPLTDWASVVAQIEAIGALDYLEGRTITFEVERNGSDVISMAVLEPYTTAFLNTQNINLIDAKVGISPEYNFSFGGSFVGSVKDVGASSQMIFTTLELLFDNSGAGAGVGVSNLAGPLGIYQITSAALSNGLISLLNWIGLLSVNLGIINLLPIPALDGGRLVFLGYEAVTRKKPNRKVENTLNYAVFMMLMGFFVFITYNDILRLFNIN